MSRLYLAAVFLLSVAAGVVYGHGGSLGGGLGVPSASSIVASIVSSRTSCVAPCAVFFDATATTLNGDDYAANAATFGDLDYVFGFDDAGGGSWAISGQDKNIEYGPLGPHIFETAGTFNPTVDVTDPATADTHQDTDSTITVTAADTQWATTKTVCVGNSLPTAGVGGCPAGATVDASSDFDQAIADNIGTGDVRILFNGNGSDVFTGATTAQLTVNGPGYIGSYGASQADIQIGVADAFNITGNDWRIVNLAFTCSLDRTPGNRCTMLTSGSDGEHILMSGNTMDGLPPCSDAPAGEKNLLFVTENQIDDAGALCRANGIGQLAFLGNTHTAITNGHHHLRMQESRKVLIGHSSFTNPLTGTHCITIRACTYDDADQAGDNCDDPTETTDSRLTVVRANDFQISVGTTPVDFKPQNVSSDELVRWGIIENNTFDITSNPGAIHVVAGDVFIRNNVIRQANNGIAIDIDPSNGGQPETPARLALIGNHRVYGNSGFQSSSGTGQSFIQANSVTGVECRNNLTYKSAGSHSGDGVNNCATESNTLCYGPSGCTSATSPYTTASPDPDTLSGWEPHVTNGAAAIDSGASQSVAPNRRDATGAVRIVPDIGAVETTIVADVATSRGDNPSCTAPCAVFFDGTGTTQAGKDYTGDARVWKGLDYIWNYADTAPGNWTLSGLSKNADIGPLGAHLYESAGTFSPTLDVTDPDTAGTDQDAAQTVTVTAADTTWATTTICYGQTGDPTAGVGDCPTGAAVATNADFDDAVTTALTTNACNSGTVPCKRVCFTGGDTFTMGSTLTISATGPGFIGACGGTRAIVDATSITGSFATLFTVNADDWRVVALDINGKITDGNDVTAFAGTGTDILVWNNDLNHVGITSDGTANRQDWAFVENIITEGEDSGIVDGGIPSYLAYLGNDWVSTSATEGDHQVRFGAFDRVVVSHGRHAGLRSARSALTFRGNDSKLAVVNSNLFTLDDGTFPLDVSPSSSSFDHFISFVIADGNRFYMQDGAASNVVNSVSGDFVLRNNMFLADQAIKINIAADEGGQPSCAPSCTGDPWIYGNSFYQTDSSITSASWINAGSVTGSECYNNLAYSAGSFSGDGVTGCATEASTICYAATVGSCTGTTSPFSTSPPTYSTTSHWEPTSPNAAVIDAGTGLDTAANRRDAEGTVRTTPDIGAVEYVP